MDVGVIELVFPSFIVDKMSFYGIDKIVGYGRSLSLFLNTLVGRLT